MLTVIFTPEIGRMIRPMGSEYTITLMVLNTKASGQRINKMDMERKPGQIKLVTRVIIRRVRSMALVSSTGLTDLLITGHLKIITSKDKVFTNGPMVVNTKVAGLTTRWMDRACSPGKMSDVMRATTLTTKKKGMVSLPGQTVVSTKVLGATVSKMVKEFTLQKMVHRKEEFGEKANASPG